jgi:hypothetical protein
MNTHPWKLANKIGVINAAITVRIRLTATPIDSPLPVIISVRYIQVRGPKDNSKIIMYTLMKTRATIPIFL